MHTVCHSILFPNFFIPKLNGVVYKTVWRVTLRTTEIYLHELGVDRKAADVFESITNEITNGKSSTNEKRAYFLQ